MSPQTKGRIAIVVALILSIWVIAAYGVWGVVLAIGAIALGWYGPDIKKWWKKRSDKKNDPKSDEWEDLK